MTSTTSTTTFTTTTMTLPPPLKRLELVDYDEPLSPSCIAATPLTPTHSKTCLMMPRIFRDAPKAPRPDSPFGKLIRSFAFDECDDNNEESSRSRKNIPALAIPVSTTQVLPLALANFTIQTPSNRRKTNSRPAPRVQRKTQGSMKRKLSSPTSSKKTTYYAKVSLQDLKLGTLKLSPSSSSAKPAVGGLKRAQSYNAMCA